MPVRRTNLTQLILDQLRSYVLNNGLVEEDRLPPERELASQLGVSRPSLRNALDWLEERGALRRVQGGGTFLQPNFLHVIADARDFGVPAETGMREALEARSLLEPILLRLACERISAEELDGLQREVNQAKFKLADAAAWRRHDLQFHSRLARAAGNSILSQALEAILSDIFLLDRAPAEAYDIARAQSDHEQILEALSWRDGELAASRMSDHLQMVGDSLAEATA